MLIRGLQKVTLLDYPGKVACTIFTGGCNFRCPFCQNSDLVEPAPPIEHISERDILDYLSKRHGLIDGICISGGEPLIQNGLEEFIMECHKLGYSVKLDTNGYVHDRLDALINNNLLDYVAMDIKSCVERYEMLSGVSGLSTEPIIKSVELLKISGIDHEFRTTVVNELHSTEDMERIGLWLKGEKKYFLQRFRDSGAILCPGLTPPDVETMYLWLETIRKYIPNAELRM